MSWSTLTPELLDKIFKQIPRFQRSPVGLVCRYWREVLHDQAFTYLSIKAKEQQIDENQLARWGCSLGDKQHDAVLCGCIDIFCKMSPLSRTTKPLAQTTWERQAGSRCGITSSKVFYSTRGNFLGVIDRLDTRILRHHYLKTPGSSGCKKVARSRIFTCNDLVVLLQPPDVPPHLWDIQSCKISLWDGGAETCLEVLELADKVPHEVLSAAISDIAISREILAIQLLTQHSVVSRNHSTSKTESWTLFWRVNTAQPARQPAHFVKLVRHPENPSGVLDTGNIAMNDKYFVRGRIDLSKTRDLTIRVYREERTRIDLVVSELETLLSTEDTKFAEGWRVPLGRRLSYVKARELLDRMKLEPGHSNRLAVYAKGDNNLRIIDLVTSNPISIITTKNWIVGSNWCCGCLLIFKSLNDQVATGTYKISIVDPGAVEKTGEKSVPAAISGFTTLGYFDCPLQWRSLPQIHMDLTGIVLNHASTDLNCYLFKSPT